MGTRIFITFFVFFVILNFEKVKILNGLFHGIFKKHVQTTLTWGQSYKTFHSCNLQIFEISVCPWQAFPAKSNVCRWGQEPTLKWSTWKLYILVVKSFIGLAHEQVLNLHLLWNAGTAPLNFLGRITHVLV